MTEILDHLLRGGDLAEKEAADLVPALVGPGTDPALAGALLAALRAKGETAAELRGFVRAMRRMGTKVRLDAGGAVDLTGTGGDRSGSLNLSTGSAILAAACGLRVIKHGNRAVSSRSGSADVLEALGMALPDGEAQAREGLARTGFTFLFAPTFHPAMKALAPVR
ncbi:MAG TPA: hypothetical protein VNI57_09395, partial [Candidatus Saccharimonadales bacterium]|nr:hypothetical protein [Candidatus Saccharimonadales bacterium]